MTGTCSRGSSTPKSPLATITPSKAWTTESRFLTASHFSILAITGVLKPNLLIFDFTKS